MNGWVEIKEGRTNETFNGYVHDVSLSGISIYTKENLLPGTFVILSLHFFGRDQMEFVKALRGEVLSCSKRQKSFQIRVRFEETVMHEKEPALFEYLTKTRKQILSGYRLPYHLNQKTGGSHIVREGRQKILAVDDIMDTIHILSAVLEKAGYTVITAMDGLEAIEKAERERPALILLDLMLPKKDGFEVCQALKEDARTKNIPIVMITARTDSLSRKNGLAVGASEYLTKPLNPRDILKKVREHLPPSAEPVPSN